tara:strand:+ start:370 stop:654 length:285 start_codon:yes stop_codon:yes gene_type:complete
MSKQIEILIEGQSKNIAPSRVQVEEVLKGHKVISVLQVSPRPSKGGWVVIAEVQDAPKVAAKPKVKVASKPKVESKATKAKPKKSFLGAKSDSE